MDAVAGNFFHQVPSGADAYILASILHDWPDEAAVRILRACRAAMPSNGSLLLIEQVLGEPNTDPVFSTESDITMMVLLGGKERTRAGFVALLGAAGLALVDTVCTPTSFSVLTATPCLTAAHRRLDEPGRAGHTGLHLVAGRHRVADPVLSELTGMDL
jgi:hypothetical protein